MARMVRKQIVIEPEQEAALEQRARELGISQSALIRRAIDEMLAAEESERLEKAGALQELWRLMDQVAESGVGSFGATWTREELHERGSD